MFHSTGTTASETSAMRNASKLLMHAVRARGSSQRPACPERACGASTQPVASTQPHSRTWCSVQRSQSKCPNHDLIPGPLWLEPRVAQLVPQHHLTAAQFSSQKPLPSPQQPFSLTPTHPMPSSPPFPTREEKKKRNDPSTSSPAQPHQKPGTGTQMGPSVN